MLKKIACFFIVLAPMAIACNKKKAIAVGKVFEQKLRVISDTTSNQTKADTLVIVAENFVQQADSFLRNNQFQYTTFSAEVDIDYADNNNQSYSITTYLKMKKDSILWLSAEVFGLEIFRVQMLPQEITILDRFSSKYRKIGYLDLKKLLGFPVDFHLAQDIIVGNPIRFGDTIHNAHKQGEQVLCETRNAFLKNIVSYLLADKQMTVQSIESIQDVVPTTCTIYYSYYQETNNAKKFSANRSIVIKGRTQSRIELSFKKIKTNIEQSYPFSIPKHYSLTQ